MRWLLHQLKSLGDDMRRFYLSHFAPPPIDAPPPAWHDEPPALRLDKPGDAARAEHAAAEERQRMERSRRQLAESRATLARLGAMARSQGGSQGGGESQQRFEAGR